MQCKWSLLPVDSTHHSLVSKQAKGSQTSPHMCYCASYNHTHLVATGN
ncbi:unnamed protein product [Brassica rapa subsp. trilocularis]